MLCQWLARPNLYPRKLHLYFLDNITSSCALSWESSTLQQRKFACCTFNMRSVLQKVLQVPKVCGVTCQPCMVMISPSCATGLGLEQLQSMVQWPPLLAAGEAWLYPSYVGIGGTVGKISGKEKEWAVDLVIGKCLGEAMFAYPLIIPQRNT